MSSASGPGEARSTGGASGGVTEADDAGLSDIYGAGDTELQDGSGGGVREDDGSSTTDRDDSTINGAEEDARRTKASGQSSGDAFGAEGVDIPPIYVVSTPEGSVSNPDDTPSIQGSILSSPTSSVPASFASHASHSRHSPLKPFERRFSARLSPSPSASPRVLSPAFLTNQSRQPSLSGSLLQQNQDEADTPQPPWEVVRWTKLKKITAQVFSEAGRRNFGKPTCLCVAVSIVVGTSKGFILAFDYHQVLKSIIGPGTKAVECGSVTSLALSADHSTVAGGHATGHIFTWELSRPSRPFLHIPPLDRAYLEDRKGDSHVSGAAIVHVGFLGTRHTALVSADDGGMAFSHLATRGLGSIARSVKTTRILGRYPLAPGSVDQPRKPSSVLAFSPLPLGNVEQPTDGLGLTALLTPYLLVIVSTTPIAQTQHKASRPKEIAPHSALSGCLAWFPAVKLKNTSGEGAGGVSKTKLVYCWSNILTVLDVEATETPEREKPPELHFRPRSRWRGEEAVVAVQWLSRSVLAVLTISQRLVILEDSTLRVTDSFDMLHKRIFHEDSFSRRLQPVVEQLDESDVSLHGVVADAFHMSFKAYKGRLFLLGFGDVTVGTLSNWADRLLALMEEGDFIAAIGLATSYYNGDADKLTVGLPDDDDARHEIVREKLVEMIQASMRYAFSDRNRAGDGGAARGEQLKELAAASFSACTSMGDEEILFEDVYEAFEGDGSEGVFFAMLEPYVLDEEITSVPPNVLKQLVSRFAAQGRAKRLEEMICRLDVASMDIDQVTTLCKRHRLYDALVYTWNQALMDYVTPLVEILSVVKALGPEESDDEEDVAAREESAQKLFPYLSYSLTGRIYPSGEAQDEARSQQAKSDLYDFLLSGKVREWPPGSRRIFRTAESDDAEPSFPYLHLILSYDAGSFMSMLNEAFEDSFLNGDQGPSDGANSQANGRAQPSRTSPTRQYIVNILLGVVASEDFAAEEAVYFYMFVARNLPKFPQYIMLPGSALQRVLVRLCEYPLGELKDDCQLSVEYLLSVYRPHDTAALVPLFEKAGFHRVLKMVYRGSRQYARLLDAAFQDVDDRSFVFDCIRDCLRPGGGLTKRQVNEFHATMVEHAADLAEIDAGAAARSLRQYAPEVLGQVIERLESSSELQYEFLRALIEPPVENQAEQPGRAKDVPQKVVERYIQLLCRFDRPHVADFVNTLQSGDLRLESVLPALEEGGVVDAAVVLMARDGLVSRAMDRLTKHLSTLESGLLGLIGAATESPDEANTEEAVGDLLEYVGKYCRVGIWLCQGQTKVVEAKGRAAKARSILDRELEASLDPDELLWLELLDTIVGVTRSTTSTIRAQPSPDDAASCPALNYERITQSLRGCVQESFSALLAATTVNSHQPGSTRRVKPRQAPIPTPTSPQKPSLSFLHVLRAFLSRASAASPSLSDLRSVLATVFAAYAFESRILALANRFLDREGFARVAEVSALRQRGWRPRSQACEGCRRRAWGPGAGGGVWREWEEGREREERRRWEKRRAAVESMGGEASGGNGKGKATAVEEGGGRAEAAGKVSTGGDSAEDLGPLVVFACRHLFHRACLERMGQTGGGEGGAATAAAEGGGAGGAGAGRRHYTCPLET